MSRIAGWFGWGLVVLLAVGVIITSLHYLPFDPEGAPEELRPNYVRNPILFYIHVIVAPIALLSGIWQFLPITRVSFYHRWAGRMYVICVAIAATAGLAVAMTSASGPIAGTGFAILAVIWSAVTAKAYFLARARNFSEHRVWMIRSYALTSAAITLRIITPTGIALGFGFTRSYIFAAWASWIINLLIAEWIIRRRPTVQILSSTG